MRSLGRVGRFRHERPHSDFLYSIVPGSILSVTDGEWLLKCLSRLLELSIASSSPAAGQQLFDTPNKLGPAHFEGSCDFQYGG